MAWPAAFGTRFTVFVDVEEEFDWAAPLSRAARATTALVALPDAHRRFAERGTGLTCLVDHPVAVDPRAPDLLGPVLDDPRSEIGAQLHPWVTPPYRAGEDVARGFPGNLAAALEAAKLDRLGESIAHAFGRLPRVYRAGRYGLGPATLRLLAARGYLADTSMRSRYSYGEQGGPDYRRIAPHAYRTPEGLLELPLTTVFTGAGARWGAGLHRLAGAVLHGRGAAARLHLLRRVALTPEDMPVGDAIRAVDAAVRGGVRVLVFSFHSPSLVPGHTPYVRDAAALRNFWSWWDAVFDRLDRHGIRFASMDELIRTAAAAAVERCVAPDRTLG